MKNQLQGKIIKIFNTNSGLIMGEDGNQYNFFIDDLLNKIELKINLLVLFKPQLYVIKNTNIYKAILISTIKD
ncbi:MAG: hypothetical protein ACK5HP_00735 [Bacilli bacterium]